MPTVPRPVVAIGAGLCLAASLPPWGWWPLAFVGVVLVDRAVFTADAPLANRFRRAWVAGFGLYLPTLFWMRDMTVPGYVIACVVFAAFLGAAVAAAPTGVGRFVAVPGALMLTEWVRWRWPFGGVPMSNLAVGQVAGPLAPVLRIGGALLLVGVTALIGMGVAALFRARSDANGGGSAETHAAPDEEPGDRRRSSCPQVGVACIAIATVVLGVGLVGPRGSGTGDFIDVALVQGGGPQGTRAETTAPGIVMERHLAATATIDRDVDLILWPEDVVDVARLAGSDAEAELAEVATTHDAAFVAGVIEDHGRDHFRNWAVAYDSSGVEADRYEKVERVPFGEWVPMRPLLERIAGDAGLPGRDALVGQTPAVVNTEAGTLAVSISWEIFFGERAREGVNHGGAMLVNPTNGASFTGTQVQTQQIANSRMRAIENGRWVTQIAPTGFSAVISPDGDVLQRTAVSEQAVLYGTIELREGRTIYTRAGDIIAVALAVLLVAGGWALQRRTG